MKTNSNSLKWIIWSLTAVFYFYEFILRVSPGIMVNELMQSFAITASSVGVLSSFYLYAYAPMQLPVGIIMDRFGIKKVLSIASVICGVGAIIFAISNFYYLAGFGRFLIGAGSSFAFIAMVYVTSYWFDAKKRAFLIGIANSLAMFGASSGVGPLYTIVKKIGWRFTISSFGIFGILLGVFIYFIFKTDKKDQKIEEKTEEKEPNLLSSLKITISKKNNWIAASSALFLYITTTAFGGLWGSSFLQSVYNIDKEKASYAVSMIFIGWLVGGPVNGFISDFFKTRTKVIKISIILTFVCLSMVIYLSSMPFYLVYILLFLTGFFSSAELLYFSIAMEMNSFKQRATACAFTNFLVSIGDGIIQPLIGYLLDFKWTGSMIENIRSYSAKNYQFAMSSLVIGVVISLILVFFIKDSKEAFIKKTN
jgi:MFS family permease